MGKYKKLKFASIGLMLLASALIIKDLVGVPEIEIGAIATHAGLLVIGIVYFFLNRRNERNANTDSKENLTGRT